MLSINPDELDRKLLSLLQVEFPLTMEPYTKLGLKLGVDGGEVIHRIHRLKTEGLVRQISPVLDGRKLGYLSTLAAMKIPERKLYEAEKIIAGHPEVSHGYEREHDFNVWITLAVPPEVDIEAETRRLASSAGALAVITLPVVKMFKLRVYFNMGGDSGSEEDTVAGTSLLPEKAELSQIDKLTINELQQDLPLIQTPFAAMASRLNMDTDSFLSECQSLLERGIIRRFGASINHLSAGYGANAMTCWVVTPDRVDMAGKKLASLREVSHCYERKTNALWRYNLFALIHSHTRTRCLEIAHEFTLETGFGDYVTLFSTREFKKTRIRYLV